MIGSVHHPTLFFPVNIVDLLDILPVQIYSRISLSISLWDFYWPCIQSIGQVGKNQHLEKFETIHPWTWNNSYLCSTVFFPAEFYFFPMYFTCILLNSTTELVYFIKFVSIECSHFFIILLIFNISVMISLPLLLILVICVLSLLFLS